MGKRKSVSQHDPKSDGDCGNDNSDENRDSDTNLVKILRTIIGMSWRAVLWLYAAERIDVYAGGVFALIRSRSIRAFFISRITGGLVVRFELVVTQRTAFFFGHRVATVGTHDHTSRDGRRLGSGIFIDLINGFVGGGEMAAALRAEVSGLDGFPAAWAGHGIDYRLGHILLPTLGAELSVRGERCAALGALVDNDIALFSIGNGRNRLHKRHAFACAVAGIFIQMSGP